MFTRHIIKRYQGINQASVWVAWADVVNWPQWDTELEYCDFKAGFEVGSHFILKPKQGPKVTISLLVVEPTQRFLSACQFPGAKMYDDHRVYQEANGVRIEHMIYVKGPLAFIWWHLVAKKVAKSIAEQTDNLIDYVRMHHA